jgi:lysine 6-dehydrogenase
VAIVPDCGLAPGISNLIAGRAVADGPVDSIVIRVGGVAEDASRPYGYVVTWSLEDLLEEYTRPARIVVDGNPTTVPVFSGLERLHVDGVGELEAFFSDGLRTLIDTLPDVRNMSEMTLRWPGHAAAVRPLVAAGRFLEEFRERCIVDLPQDLVVLRVDMRRGKTSQRVTLVSRHDPASGLTAMSRTTALTCSVVAQLVAEGGLKETGVLPLERVARDARCHRFVLDGLAARGVRPIHE